MMHSPLPYRWDGESFIPISQHWAREADKEFVVGEVYRLSIIEERSRASHAHFFASVNEAWKNLPERLADRFPSAEHLRKYSLVRCGYRDERSIVCASKAEAQRLAAFVKPMDDYAVVVARERVVVVWTAKSQSMRAMGREEFQRSKDAVLDYLASLIGTDHAALTEAGRAA